jgi:hypothetical protein
MVAAGLIHVAGRPAVAIASVPVAKAQADVSFRATLEASAAVETPAKVKPEPPADGAGAAGDGPLAKMRPPVASSTEDAAPLAAMKVQEDVHGKPSQDTGAVVVTKPNAVKKDVRKDDPAAKDEEVSPEAVDAKAAVQQDAQPLLVTPVVQVPVTSQSVMPQTAAPETATSTATEKIVASGSTGKGRAGEPKKVESTTVDVAPAPRSQAVAPAASVESPQVAAALTAVKDGLAYDPLSSGAAHAGVVEKMHAEGKSADGAAVPPQPLVAAQQGDEMQTLAATPNVLEIGVASGSHGWLRVRAEMGQAGEVSASVSAAAGSAAQNLHRELPAISAYLASERVGVSSLVVNAMEKSAAAHDVSSSLHEGSQAGTGQGRQRGSEQKVPWDFNSEGDSGIGPVFAAQAMSMPAALYTGGNGSWLSVRV